MFEAACEINKARSSGKNVYVHCTAGMGRAPAVTIAYLILFKKVSMYQDPSSVAAWVKSYRKVSVPNLKAIQIAVNMPHFKELQSK